MVFFSQEYWSGSPFPSPEDLADPGIKPTSPVSPASQADSSPTEPSGKQFVCDSRTHSSTSSIVAQSSLMLCHPMDCSLTGSSVHGIRQERMLENGLLFTMVHLLSLICTIHL